MGRDELMNRRALVVAAGIAGLDAVLAGSTAHGASGSDQDEEKEHPVTPAEDLMFEHGVLERLLLIYAEAIRRIESGATLPTKVLFDTAGLFRRFGEDYHEKLEEQQIFPVLEKDGRYAELARELRKQHDAGRKITASLLDTTKGGTPAPSRQAVQALRSFQRMYLPHISRENSVAFRAFHSLVPYERYKDLGEEFEGKEHEILGEDGFERTLDQVAAIEKSLDIYDIAQLTPDETTG